MFDSLKRAELLDVIQRCAWLVEYYERTGVSPESVKTFQAARDKAINDLAALPRADPPDVLNLDEPQLACPTSPSNPHDRACRDTIATCPT